MKVDLSEFESVIPRRQSKLDIISEKLDNEQRAKLHTALRTNGITNRAIVAVLGKWGHDISEGAINEARKRLRNGTANT